MGATYDPVLNRITLSGDGAGWQWMRQPITVPADKDQAIYVMRMWIDTLASDTELRVDNALYNTAYHFGLSFDIDQPEKPTPDGEANAAPVYTDFLGPGQFAAAGSGGALTDAGMSSIDNSAPKTDYVALFFDSVFADLRSYVGDGNGTDESIRIIQDSAPKEDAEMPYTVPRDPTLGAAYTLVWRVRKSNLNDEVTFEAWVNTDSIDLDSLNLDTDIDPGDPKAAIPVSNGWEDTAVINGAAESGTNWIPSPGVMDFPPYFMFRYPMATEAAVIDYLGVQYSKLGVV